MPGKGLILRFTGWSCLIMTGLSAVAMNANAATYYVDYASGNDIQSGNSAQTAWQHAPGDDNATGLAAAAILQPGDVVLFRGGTVYQGSIALPASGTADQPIVYKGDGWGSQKAIIDGRQAINTNWTPCSSESDCMGNTQWANICYTTLPTGISSIFAKFFQGDDALYISQAPNPSDRINYDNISEFYSIPHTDMTQTSVTDADVFVQTDPDYWVGATAGVWTYGNVVAYQEITAYASALNTVYYAPPQHPPYDDRDEAYALFNHPFLIDEPGELALDNGSNRLYLWPLRTPVQAGDVSIVQDEAGIFINGQSYVVVEGFHVQHTDANGIKKDWQATSHVIIRNNEVGPYAGGIYAGDDYLVENNYVHDSPRTIGILGGGVRCSIKDNRVNKTTRQGIWFMEAYHSRIVGNEVMEIKGTHSNGISVYQYSENILVAHNKITNTNSAMTIERSHNITIYNNYIEGALNDWGDMTGNIVVANNTLEGIGIGSLDTAASVIIINNITGSAPGAPAEHTYNYYMALSWSQQPRYHWAPGAGELVDWDGSSYLPKDIDLACVNAAVGDYHLIENSLAKDAGVNPAACLPIQEFSDYNFWVDLDGNERPQGEAWDIGAYEYVQPGPNVTSLGSLYAYPNPASGRVTFFFEEKRIKNATINIYNMAGERIALVKAGYPDQRVPWDAYDMAPGVYLYRAVIRRLDGSVKTYPVKKIAIVH